MKYFLACNLRGDVVAYHKKLVKDIADNFGIISPLIQKLEPHVTLKYSFEASEPNELKDLLQIFCDKHIKTNMTIGGYGSFRDDVIFLKTELSSEARNVFLDLIRELKQLSWMSWTEHDSENLHFHSTIASRCQDKFAEIIDFTKGTEKTFVCWLDNITIWEEGEICNNISTWYIHKIFNLKS